SPASVRRTSTTSPGAEWRTKTTRPSTRATQCPPWAGGPTVTPVRTSMCSALLSGPGDGGDDGAGQREQPRAQPLRSAAEQQPAPPAPGGGLGQVDDGEPVRLRAAGGGDVRDHPRAGVAGRCRELDERDGEVQRGPLPAQGRRGVLVDRHGER